MGPVVSDAEIKAAAARLRGVVVATPLVPFPAAGPLMIKPESLQPTGAFKLRGAYNAISVLPDAQRQRGVVAHSSGNHGHAVAYAARLLGVRAVIVVPETAPAIKTDAIIANGAELVTVAPTMAARLAAVRDLADRHGYALIPPFDDPNVIAGQGTIGLEIMASQPDTDLILVPVSGGGLISGVAAAARSVNPDVTVVGVEPDQAADAQESLRSGGAGRLARQPGPAHGGRRAPGGAGRGVAVRAHAPVRGRNRDRDRRAAAGRGTRPGHRRAPGG